MKTVLIAGILITLCHGVFLLWAERRQELLREDREKLWRVHKLLNGTLWKLLGLGIIVAEFVLPHSIIFPQSGLGLVLIVIGAWLVVKTHLDLGSEVAMGRRFFFPEEAPMWLATGVYSFLTHPMYDGFLIIFLGLAVTFHSIENFYFALASFLLFNVFLALVVENRGYPFRPF